MGCHNCTLVESGVYITTPECTKQIDRDSIKVVDSKVYLEVKVGKKFRALPGADHQNERPVPVVAPQAPLRGDRCADGGRA